jgi:hypothetical protein
VTLLPLPSMQREESNALQCAITEIELALISLRAALDADTSERALEWLAEGNGELARASVLLDEVRSIAWAEVAANVVPFPVRGIA